MKTIFKKLIALKNWFIKASWKKKAIIIVLMLLALFILTSPLRVKGPQYTSEPVTRDTVVDTVSESGNVTSSGRFDVYSTSTGYIEEVYVANGDSVKVGQNLFRVKSTATPQDKASAYSNYLSAQNTLNSAGSKTNSLQSAEFKANQKFINDAVDRNLATDDPTYIQENADWLQAEADYKNQATVVTQAQASLNSATIAYQATQDMIDTAPAPGTIANFSASVGDKVTATSATSALASTATSGAPALVILGDISKTAIRIPLNEVDVDKVKIGQSATITFDAFRDKQYKGHVTTIDTAGTNTNGVITYNATVAIHNPDSNIKPEMTTTVSIETAKKENVLTVPNSAIKPYKGGKAVIVTGVDKDSQVKNKAGNKLPLHYVPVKVGLKGVMRTEITEGISDGTLVVSSSIN